MKDVTQLIDRNRSKLIGGGLISGYPKIAGKRRFTTIIKVIYWRQIKIDQKKRFADLLSRFTPEEIFDKMMQKK